MPIYEYECANCKNLCEFIQKFSDKPKTKCPHCGQDTISKMVSRRTGLKFKGTGFYETDYKNK